MGSCLPLPKILIPPESTNVEFLDFHWLWGAKSINQLIKIVHKSLADGSTGSVTSTAASASLKLPSLGFYMVMYYSTFKFFSNYSKLPCSKSKIFRSYAKPEELLLFPIYKITSTSLPWYILLTNSKSFKLIPPPSQGPLL